MGPRKPRPLKAIDGLLFEIRKDARWVSVRTNDGYTTLRAPIYKPDELRLLAKWLNRAADWIDAHRSKT